VCGWVNLRSHLAISFNQCKNVCVVLLWRVTYPKMKDGLILMSDLPNCKMVSFWRVTYPSGEKGRVVSFLWVTYPGEEWPHYNGWPTQVKKKKMENGLILMGDLPKCKMVSLWWVTYPSGEKGRVVSFLWVTYPGEEWPHYNGWPTQVKKKMENGLILMGDLPKWKGGRVVSFLWVTYPGGRVASL